MRRIAVVGASLAGLRAVEALRRRGFDGELWLVGDEPHAPYDRPPLSKQLLRGEWDAERLTLRRDGLSDLQLELRLGLTATALDGARRTLVLSDGSRLDCDGVVIATGARARRLPLGEGLSGVHLLRTLDDAQSLREALVEGPRVTVVGAGFIGLEVAASCRALGLSVCVVEPLEVPLAPKLGREMGQGVAALHRDGGVDLRCGLSVERLEGKGRVERAVLSDGSRLETDLAVIGVGVIPNTEWLAGSGVEVDDGVRCDERCATAVPGVVAAGDVARWPNRLFDESMRVEHWTNAVEQADAAAARLLDGASVAAFEPVPYFWSDQFDRKLQFAGRTGDRVEVVEGGPGEDRMVALYARHGRLTGVLAVSRPARFIRFRRMVAERASFADALAAARGGEAR